MIGRHSGKKTAFEIEIAMVPDPDPAHDHFHFWGASDYLMMALAGTADAGLLVDWMMTKKHPFSNYPNSDPDSGSG